MQQYRHEQKYLIDTRQEAALLLCCQEAMQLDPHTSEDGTYVIHSLYFDDPEDSCLRENLDRVDCRSKFRIRRYDHNPERILLEKKSKLHGLTRKDSCLLTDRECQMLTNGFPLFVTPDMEPVKQALLTELQLRRLQPKQIVSYERVPFVCEAGNVRVTFDRKLTSSADTSGFLTGRTIRRPVFPDGTCLL